MEAGECRERLVRLIGEERSALDELAALLEREHGYLLENDVAALAAESRTRQRCVARIVKVDQERRDLCSARGYSLDLQGLQQLLRWCDPQGSLSGAWSQCSAAAARCRTLNDRNGALCGARLQHVQARLEALIQGRRESLTYGPRGASGVTPAGRVLVTEV